MFAVNMAKRRLHGPRRDVIVSAVGAVFNSSPGATSQEELLVYEASALKARFTFGQIQFIIGGVPQQDSVLKYVDNQLKHHPARTFQEEYRELLRKHGVDFDERYVWD